MSAYDPQKTYRCWVTNEEIPAARVEYLLNEGIPEERLTSLKGSEMTHRPRKMLFVDDESNFFICDKIDETRVYATERFSEEKVEDEAAEEKEETFFVSKVKIDEEEDEV
jgi:hypothetical protein